ncbi:rhamnosyltransferase [Arthrobacter sp. V4I6]|uniref:glycosyltransferase n=1 Tax=unclassified Arthrobacter TaxID=235627 RepID=UPI002786BCDB|nr:MULTISPECIES: glycosyltransferase [unclassified Arthrobacter]MDQ0820225.1 rhamnosyltransferase [Arthrobacter sp. V1I7]MDQ0854408.1 rhamnosyltransferase [Arthrobacter sp. V4I6]
MTLNDPTPTVVAVVAAYRPDPSLAGTVRSLLEQVSHVVVVDDGSPAGSEEVLAALADAGATVVRQSENTGIAAALNAGVAAARSRWNPDFFLTLDQDSQPADDYVRRGLTGFARATSAGIAVGFVTAASYSGHPIPVLHRHGEFVHAFDPMQSGFLIPRSTVENVGPFEEDLFIDGVDSEFTMRTRTAGLAVLVGAGCDMVHDLGQRQPGRLFGRPLKILGRDISYNYHSPSRVYYIARNGTLLTRRYLLKDPRWVLRRLLEECKAHLLRFAFSSGRAGLLKAAAAGFRDALRGTTGRIPADLERRLR